MHRDYPAADLAHAIQQALTLGRADLEGVRLCLHQLHEPTSPAARLDLSMRPQLAALGQQPVSLAQYEQLLAVGG